MYLSKVCSLSALVAGILIISGCSSGNPDGPSGHLSGPNQTANQAGSAPRYQQRSPGVAQPRYNVSRRAAVAPQAQQSNCSTEPVARRPFPRQIIVRRGDNLCRIARRYQTTVQAVVDANRLSSSKIDVGMRLQLPPQEYYSNNPFGRLQRR